MPRWLEALQGTAQIWHVSSCLEEGGVPVLTVWKLAKGDYFRFLYADGTHFIMDRLGTQVWATWPITLTAEDTATYLLGPVLGFVLRLRGMICLHASAIVVDDRAIALLGPAGVGKSTTAAAFAQLGYKILSDDVVALTDQGNTFLAQPAYPCIRLWPESVQALYGTANALPRLTPTWDKRCLALSQNGRQFQQQPLPLFAIYILNERRSHPTAPYVEAVDAIDGMMTLIANTYTSYLIDKKMRAHEFEVLRRVMANVHLRRAVPHADPAYLSKLCVAILDDHQAMTSSAFLVADSQKGPHV
jgi:hypothetical protein